MTKPLNPGEWELTDLSTNGFYLRTREPPDEESDLSFVMRLLPGDTTLTIEGRVLRVDPRTGREFGVAVKITRHSFR